MDNLKPNQATNTGLSRSSESTDRTEKTSAMTKETFRDAVGTGGLAFPVVFLMATR